MKALLILFVLFSFQDSVTIIKNNGDQLVLSDVKIYQTESSSSSERLKYSYRGVDSEIAFNEIKRISFKETVKKKKGVSTYRVILVKTDNGKLEVEMDLVRLEGMSQAGKNESMNFSSVDKISF